MRFLHISDLHIGKVVNDFSMLEDQRFLLGQIAGIAEENRVDAVVIAGDVYDRAERKVLLPMKHRRRNRQ